MVKEHAIKGLVVCMGIIVTLEYKFATEGRTKLPGLRVYTLQEILLQNLNKNKYLKGKGNGR